MTARRPAWIYDGSEIPDPKGYGQRAVEFLRALRHPKSKLEGKAFDLPMFWERIVKRIYGPVDDRGHRQVKTVFALMPRGARKTTIGAGLGLLHTFGYERTDGGLALAAASAEDQATIAYDEALGIHKVTPWLKDAAKATESLFLLEHPKSGSALQAIPADGDAQLGKTPTFALCDELIAWKNRKLWRAIRTGMVKTPGSLLIVITQAGRGQQNLAYEMLDYARRVASGSIDDPGFLPVLFEADPDDNWRDEALWHVVNPGLELGFPDLPGLRQLAREAAERPSDRDDFKQFNLNMWLEQSASPFVDMAVYDVGAAELDLAALESLPCWLGVDVSATTDLTAVVAVWKHDVGVYSCRAWFFVPADNLLIRGERDKVPYPRWAAEGWITATPGNVVDYRAVEMKIREIVSRFDVQEIAFDRAYGAAVMNPLTDDGLPVVTLQQGWITQAPAVKELERAIVGRTFRHDGNPVLRWCFENVAVHRDSNSNATFHKGKSRDRIDGATGCWMAVSRASAGDREISIFDRPELWSDAPAEPNAAAPAEDDDSKWDPKIIADRRHPQFQEHKRRFEAWQALQPED